MLMYPSHIRLSTSSEGNPTLTCKQCQITIERKGWMGNRTWIIFQEGFLKVHEKFNHRRVEPHEIH